MKNYEDKKKKNVIAGAGIGTGICQFSGMEVRAEGTEGHTHNWKYSIKKNKADTIVASCETANIARQRQVRRRYVAEDAIIREKNI